MEFVFKKNDNKKIHVVNSNIIIVGYNMSGFPVTCIEIQKKANLLCISS